MYPPDQEVAWSYLTLRMTGFYSNRSLLPGVLSPTSSGSSSMNAIWNAVRGETCDHSISPASCKVRRSSIEDATRASSKEAAGRDVRGCHCAGDRLEKSFDAQAYR